MIWWGLLGCIILLICFHSIRACCFSDQGRSGCTDGISYLNFVLWFVFWEGIIYYHSIDADLVGMYTF